ncbi:hypothetical protein FWG76_01160 [Candidatus Saccharibacteria bacterium]|nr:hypothetical protein [Candidatus Saccharibacteria bacterium]
MLILSISVSAAFCNIDFLLKIWLTLTQLGVNASNVIYNGKFANNPLFFGTAISEIISLADFGGGWNNDLVHSISSTIPWFMRGADYAIYPNSSGIFAFIRADGSASPQNSHRTILLGY